jgi:uncharacterized membrane protein YagU involved in acid resistance
MRIKSIIADVGVGLISGYVGTKLMESVSMKWYEWEPEADRQREDAVRPGPPYTIAAQKVTRLIGLQLSDSQLEQAGMAFHYGLGMSWGPIYLLVRRLTPLPPIAAGLLTGAVMSLLVDEGLTPLLDFSAPNRAYPLVTHLRGVVAHLVFGLGVAGTAESIRFLGQNQLPAPFSRQ